MCWRSSSMSPRFRPSSRAIDETERGCRVTAFSRSLRNTTMAARVSFGAHACKLTAAASDSRILRAQPPYVADESRDTRDGVFFLGLIFCRHVPFVPTLGKELPDAIEIDEVAIVETVSDVRVR